MNRYRTLLGLPSFALNVISLAVALFIICLGIRVVKASDLALEVADTKLVTSSSAKKLERLAEKLEQQAEIIEQKDRAYRELQQVYESSLKGKTGYKRLQEKIEKVKNLPQAKNVEKIKQEIEATEEILIEAVGE